MKKIILICFLISSCATVKKTNTETEIKTDSTSVKTYSKWIDSDRFSLQPADLSQPMRFVNSKGEIKEYHNTIIKYEKEKSNEIKKDSTSKQIDLKQEKTEKEKDYSEVIESVSNRLFLLILALFIINKIIDKIKPKALLL